jgi:hypothetical protein
MTNWPPIQRETHPTRRRLAVDTKILKQVVEVNVRCIKTSDTSRVDSNGGQLSEGRGNYDTEHSFKFSKVYICKEITNLFANLLFISSKNFKN